MPSQLNQFWVEREKWKLSYFYTFMTKRERHLKSSTAMLYDFFRKCWVQAEVFALTLVFWIQLRWPSSLLANTNQFWSKTTYILHLIIMVFAVSKRMFLCLYCTATHRLLLFHSPCLYSVLYGEQAAKNWGSAPPEEVFLFAFGHSGVVTDEGCEQEESKLWNSISYVTLTEFTAYAVSTGSP